MAFDAAGGIDLAVAKLAPAWRAADRQSRRRLPRPPNATRDEARAHAYRARGALMYRRAGLAALLLGLAGLACGTSDAAVAPGGGSNGGTATDGGSLAYDVIDLGPAVVYSIDPQGRVAGNAILPSGRYGGGIYSHGSGWSAVPVPDGATLAEPVGVDETGNIAINAWFPQPCHKCSIRHSYMAAPLRPVPFERHDFQTSIMNAIHPATGHVVGYDQVLGGAYFYDGTVTPIAVQPAKTFENGGPSQATALNIYDLVVGWMRVNPDSSPYNSTPAHAFLWDHGNLIDLGGGTGAGGTCDAQATGINDAGVVVGMIDIGARCGEPQMFLWDGRMHIIGCPRDAARYCLPRAINARGDIVGEALIGIVNGGIYAFIYHEGTFRRLDELVDASGWQFEYAIGINDTNQILGWGTLNGGTVRHAFVLTPR
jgi:hypothetical protein